MNAQEPHVPYAASERIRDCPLASPEHVLNLQFRDAPYWHTLLLSRHTVIYRPNDRVCTWIAGYLTRDRKYRQIRLGPALNTGKGKPLSLTEAVELAFEWFASPEIERPGNEAVPFAEISTVNGCPIGDTYTVGHALKDYT